jgi:hypothetical protein
MTKFFCDHRTRKYLEQLSPEDRQLWRKWQIGWCCIYCAVLAVLVGTAFLLPGSADTQLAGSSTTEHASVRLSGLK